jgi:type II secretory ATPase GspE/PulE/Tfp pilus assembly ATPase PilB-like protein
MARKQAEAEEVPLHEQFPPVEFKASGASPQEQQANLLAAKHAPGYLIARGYCAQALAQRVDQMLLDYTRDAVGMRFQVDGIWHNVAPLDRQSGDAMLVVLKKLANLNPADRRSRQQGSFQGKFVKDKYVFSLTTQGTQTGERALLKIEPEKPRYERLEQLGMREKVRTRVKQCMDGDGGLIVFSTPPSGGLSTLWRIAIVTTDRFVKDFVSIEDVQKPDEEIINVTPHFYDSQKGETPASILPKLMLKEPDTFVVPHLVDANTVKAFCEHATKRKHTVLTRLHAKDATESLLRLLAYKAPPKLVAEAVTLVVNQRLCRRLCPSCKQAYQPAPPLLQKLGIPEGRVQAFYREFQPPPPEQLVDDKGNPIEIPVCQECNGLRYKGRIGIFEVLFVDDRVRQVMAQQPKLDALRTAARQAGCRTLQEEGILLVKKLLHEDKYTVEGAKQKLDRLRRSGDLGEAVHPDHLLAVDVPGEDRAPDLRHDGVR